MSVPSLIITENDYKLIQPRDQLPQIILEKTSGFWSKGTPPHSIDPKQFDTIYTTSDIHADVYKLNTLLSSSGLIDSTGFEDRSNILEKPFKWLKPKTLFVIVGDVVDGARNGFSEILDPIGDIELILHIYIFNLRLMAHEVGSEIRFTIGNHDYHSVVKENSDDLPDFYNSWVHTSAIRFFGSRTTRRDCLLPFYLCSPYFIITVANELAFIHAGINSEDGQDIMDLSEAIVLMQTKLDADGDFAKLSKGAHKFLSEIGADSKEGGPLWTRFYSFGSPADVCDALEDPYKMVIVGHCQTDSCSQGQHMANILKDPQFSACGSGGCVLLGCNKKGPPALGFVDISMSSAFRNRISRFGFPIYPPQIIKADEERRRAEFLKLEHVPELDTSDRYYNKISREKVGGTGANESLVYWQAQPVPPAQQPVPQIQVVPVQEPVPEPAPVATNGGSKKKSKNKRKNKGKNKKTKKHRSF